MSNIFFKMPRRHPMPSGPFLGSIFPLTPYNFLYTKLPLYTLIISDFRLLLYKFVPINFLDAKNGPEGCLRGLLENDYSCQGTPNP